MFAFVLSPCTALVAPDDFKGTFPAADVAAAIARGLRRAGVCADEMPIADGGDGTMAALVAARGGRVHHHIASDPLGRPAMCRWAMLGDGRTAVVESAEASGLKRVRGVERDPWRASTAGTGELIVAAARAGASEVIVGMGGSATVDGGRGAVEVIQAAGLRIRMRVLCDVQVGFADAARTFGPQKGADPAMVECLEARLRDLAERAPRDPRGQPMTGAAGGLAGALWAYFDATLVPGASQVLDALNFDVRLGRAAIVVSGEGRLDEQTLTGKAVAEVARRASGAGRPLHVVTGSNTLTGDALRRLGVASVHEATTQSEIEEAAYDLGHELLCHSAAPSDATSMQVTGTTSPDEGGPS